MSEAKRVRIGEIEIEYKEIGGEPGKGDDVFVLVHGFTGSRDDWREQLPNLAQLGRTIAIDQRGHGGSTNTGSADGYTIAQMADDLRGFLDSLGIDRVDLLGHSMGGAVALRFALTHPERLRSLVLMDTAACAVTLLPDAVLEPRAAAARAKGTGVIARGMRAGAAKGNARQAPSTARMIERLGFDAHWDRIQAKMDAMDPEAFAALGGCPFEEVGNRLSEIACPTLVIVGAEDQAFLEPSREIGKAIANARLCVIEDAAHSPQLENADAWLAAVREHLESARGGDRESQLPVRARV